LALTRPYDTPESRTLHSHWFEGLKSNPCYLSNAITWHLSRERGCMD
jgi:hypothetical protein